MIEDNLAIKVSNLTKRFGDLTAVNDISFFVQKGEIFAFLGPNGAGKSTTIKMLTTLLSPSSGTIAVAGFNPVQNQDKVRESFGIIFHRRFPVFKSCWEKRSAGQPLPLCRGFSLFSLVMKNRMLSLCLWYFQTTFFRHDASRFPQKYTILIPGC